MTRLAAIAKPVYQCPFCYFKDTDIGIIERHAKYCLHNPDRKTCYSCKFGCSYGMKSHPDNRDDSFCPKLKITIDGRALAKDCPEWEKGADNEQE